MLFAMKVGIDTFGCDSGRSGHGSYLSSLINALPEDSSLSWELFGPEIDRYTYTEEKSLPFTSVQLSDSLNRVRLWHLFRCNAFSKKRSYDAVLYAAGPQLLPRVYKKPGVVIVNDVISSFLKNENSRWYKGILVKSLASADCIVAGSEFIRGDMEKCGIRTRRLEVVYSGIDHGTFTHIGKSESDVVDIKPFAIKKPYLIYPSRMQGRAKKHVELIQAFSLFKERTGLPHRLVIAGSEGRDAQHVKSAALSSPYASDILITGYFPHENFGDLYRNADACVFPSVNEGIGLPVMESMASGLPVACSSGGALKEIAGEGAIYFDSDSIEEMASCIERIVTDRNLREILVKAGLEKAGKYSWEKTAGRMLEIVKSVCG